MTATLYNMHLVSRFLCTVKTLIKCSFYSTQTVKMQRACQKMHLILLEYFTATATHQPSPACYWMVEVRQVQIFLRIVIESKSQSLCCVLCTFHQQKQCSRRCQQRSLSDFLQLPNQLKIELHSKYTQAQIEIILIELKAPFSLCKIK